MILKRISQILFILILCGIGAGYYYKFQDNDALGDKIIGFSVVTAAFIFMPIFIYHRSKGKNFRDYMLTKENLDKMNENEEDDHKQQ
ncbi:hypothetical protein ACG2LH_03845 [Zhouia sp. PK063]|uniref:hypothetical protein n=1 Tax=Zhouia sp. PK063 TaxID=3373602 RepID=UPI0037A4D7F0